MCVWKSTPKSIRRHLSEGLTSAKKKKKKATIIIFPETTWLTSFIIYDRPFSASLPEILRSSGNLCDISICLTYLHRFFFFFPLIPYSKLNLTTADSFIKVSPWKNCCEMKEMQNIRMWEEVSIKEWAQDSWTGRRTLETIRNGC